VGAVGIAMGLLHVAAPDLKQDADPISRLANAVVNVVQVSIPLEEIEGPEGIAAGAVQAAKKELRRQARNAAANDLMRAAVTLLVGGFIYRYHEQKINAAVAPPPQSWAPPPAQSG
ncbi:MAG: hypothetical protein ACRDJM_06485, partial [Actinomycetota bacterium]